MAEQIGYLAKMAGAQLAVRVLQSGAGYYLGTQTSDGQPFSRESAEYFLTASDARKALSEGAWTQRPHP